MDPETYMLYWKGKGGEEWYEGMAVLPQFQLRVCPSDSDPPEASYLGASYTRLTHFMKDVATNGDHTAGTVFGPNSSFFSMSPSGFCWQNLPPELEDNIQNRIKARPPTCVALGVEGTYFVVYSDGTTSFDLRGQYPRLDTLIMEEAPGRRGFTVDITYQRQRSCG
ncbi:hypothetical protein B0H14DRAFT_2595893 [Mycena olivaceomarginata]|nr:hypothetical protein B0H14DRAFT_2595893 [Mycena olivaceomarginata]